MSQNDDSCEFNDNQVELQRKIRKTYTRQTSVFIFPDDIIFFNDAKKKKKKKQIMSQKLSNN